MASRPKTKILWGRVAFYTGCLVFCLYVWYHIIRLGSEMFFRLNQGGV